VLSEAVNEALPELYTKAVEESEVRTLGQPDVEITQLDDGKEFTFTAEVEVQPKFELPDLSTLTVTVDNAAVKTEDVDEYLDNLRERFASLKTADRSAENGDYTSIDLSASVEGESVEDAQASGLSYELGSGTMLEGLDEALAGMAAGESKTFTSELAGGAKAGEDAEVLARRRIPEEHRAIVASAHQQLAVRRERYAADPARVAHQSVKLTSGAHVPQFYGGVLIARRQRAAVGREGD